jgi:hypothetical protein
MGFYACNTYFLEKMRLNAAFSVSTTRSVTRTRHVAERQVLWGFASFVRTTAVSSKRKPKASKHAKIADVGHWVHTKGTHVTSLPQLKRWFGSKAMSKYLSGIVKERILFDETGRKKWFYKVQYDLPTGKTSTATNKAIHHFPDKWIDPDSPPEAVAWPIHCKKSDRFIDRPTDPQHCQKRVGPACLQHRRVHHCQRRLVRLDLECA